MEGDINTLWERVADYIVVQFDMDNLKNVFLSGDGAGWIRKGEEWLPNCIPILDAYHMNKAVIGLTASVPEGKSRAMALLNVENEDGFNALCCEILMGPMLANQQQRKKKLVDYLSRNWQRIQNRKLDDALGCSAEGHVSHILLARLSSRPLGWGENNLMTMAQLRVIKANKEQISYAKNKRPASTPAISHLPPMTPEIHERIRTTVSKEFTITQFSLPILIAGISTSLYQALHGLTFASLAS